MFMFPVFLGADGKKEHHHHHRVDTKGIEKSIDKLGNKVEQAGLDISAGTDTVAAAIHKWKHICMFCEKDLTKHEDKVSFITALEKNKLSMFGFGSSYYTPCCKTVIEFNAPNLVEQFSSDQYAYPEPIDTWKRFIHHVEWYVIERTTIRRSTGTCMHHQPKMSYATPEVLVCGDQVEGWV